MAKETVRPKKALGQNFLVNDGVCEKIADAVVGDGNCGVLEIGPGLGALTKKLAPRARKLVAVELDADILPKLRENLAGFDNVEIVNADVLSVDLQALIREHFAGMPVRAAGNLPYYITSPIVMALLESRLPLEEIVVMVQKEAAQRLCAKEGARECGAVTLAVRYYAEPQMLFDVSPGSFYPAPKVTSSVLRLRVRKQPLVTPRDERRMFAVIKAAFSMRRKTVLNAVAGGLSLDKETLAAAMARAGVDPGARAERLTLADYSSLSDEIIIQ
ncbi:MAG: 16S rRNA (adenine(1518)-N(6)/adenine(1519)-N(6))-dimethyltransferase RsmA [Oscillospiraceae bacterium]|nr:16S rRNA (adenine(1518)-N(6)/adenine(1519)-N(6))-dimethyltransferase RsmA [Oscillospiraceae bacterium]